jgi:orotidine 5'-phosphate decarboxylase subfamily 2
MPARGAAEAGASGVANSIDVSLESYLARLGRRQAQTGSALCLGVDPHPELVPAARGRGVEGVEWLARTLVESAGPVASAIKLNIAFFEAFGGAGIAALERVRATIPADLPVILDAKRADIGSTSERHAVALFDALGADAVTANPYLGLDALEPLLSRADRFVYVLCRTSNPGGAEFQELEVAESRDDDLPREPLYLRVARRARAWGGRFGTAGLVVGATGAPELRRVRSTAPELPFLVPGVGAQGGDAEATLRDGPVVTGPWAALPGGGLLVNISRAISSAVADGGDPEAALGKAAREWSARLRC